MSDPNRFITFVAALIFAAVVTSIFILVRPTVKYDTRPQGVGPNLVSTGLIVVTNQPSSNYSVAMYRNDIQSVTNGTLSDRITALAALYFDRGFDIGFATGKSGGSETNAARIKKWHREFLLQSAASLSR